MQNQGRLAGRREGPQQRPVADMLTRRRSQRGSGPRVGFFTV